MKDQSQPQDLSQDGRKTTRRNAVLLLGGLAGVAAGWQLWLARPRSLVFEPLADLPGWSIARTADITGTAADAVLAGLDTTAQASLPVGALAGAVHPDGRPVAVFSDVRCPHCRRLVPELGDRLGPEVTYHALPVFGRLSELAARASVAADLQGADGAMHVRLHAVPLRPSPRFWADEARALGLDGARLLREMDSTAVTRQLTLSRRAADRLGIWGTPGIVIGQRVVVGALSVAEIQSLLT